AEDIADAGGSENGRRARSRAITQRAAPPLLAVHPQPGRLFQLLISTLSTGCTADRQFADQSVWFLPNPEKFARPFDRRLRRCALSSVHRLRIRRLKDALNGSIQQSIEFGVRLLGRQALDQRPRKAGDDAVVPPEPLVRLITAIAA